MSNEVLIALISTAAGVLVGLIGWAGKRSESSTASVKTLVEGYAARVEQLEERTDKLEARLEETRRELHWHQRHSLALRRALAAAIEWIADAVEWINGPRTSPPPSPPDSEPWKDLIAAVSEGT
ncbi:MAG: hypothetical protein Q4G46_13295 [Propionibacteriaceae bacterium]|nr:hypothetical protein [Propionibacteriaceae bacterium]